MSRVGSRRSIGQWTSVNLAASATHYAATVANSYSTDPISAYVFELRSTNSAGTSADSAPSSSVLTPFDTSVTPPGAPSNLQQSTRGGPPPPYYQTTATQPSPNTSTGNQLSVSASPDPTASGAPAPDVVGWLQAPSTTYTFQERNYNTGGFSSWSNTISYTTGNFGVPPQPTNVVATSTTPGRIDLSWSGSQSGVNYSALVSSDGTYWQNPPITLNADGHSGSITSGLLPGTTYQVRVMAEQNYPVAFRVSSSATVTTAVTPQTVSIAAVDPTAVEAGPDGAAEPGVFLVSRSGGDLGQPLAVSYSVGGSASAGSDYQPLAGSVTIPAGAVATPIAVNPLPTASDASVTTVVATMNASAPGAVPAINVAPGANVAVINVVGAPTAQVSQLTFGATNASDFHNVHQDGTAYIYDGPEWQAGQRAYPICYTRSGTADGNVTMTVAAQLNVAGFQGGNCEIRGIWDGQQATANAVVNNGVLSATLTETKPITAVIDKHTTEINWEASADGGKTWIKAGETKDATYVMGGKPSGDQLLETVLNTGCTAAKGQAAYNGVVNSIWAALQARTIARVDGTPMRYYGAVSSRDVTPLPDTDFTTAGLVQYADGRCEAWSHFLVDAWGAQGITAEFWGITPNANAYKAPQGTTLKGFRVTTKTAQNGTATTDAFTNHAVVELANSTSIYDPSYGQYETEWNGTSSTVTTIHRIRRKLSGAFAAQMTRPSRKRKLRPERWYEANLPTIREGGCWLVPARYFSRYC